MVILITAICHLRYWNRPLLIWSSLHLSFALLPLWDKLTLSCFNSVNYLCFFVYLKNLCNPFSRVFSTKTTNFVPQFLRRFVAKTHRSLLNGKHLSNYLKRVWKRKNERTKHGLENWNEITSWLALLREKIKFSTAYFSFCVSLCRQSQCTSGVTRPNFSGIVYSHVPRIICYTERGAKRYNPACAPGNMFSSNIAAGISHNSTFVIYDTHIVERRRKRFNCNRA